MFDFLSKKKHLSFRKITTVVMVFILSGLGCRFKANYPLVGPRFTGRVLSPGAYQKDPSPYLHEFRRKLRKTANG